MHKAWHFWLFGLSMAANLLWAARDLSWWMVPAVLAGWYLADAASGLIHMIMDYYPLRRDHRLRAVYFYRGSRNTDTYRTQFQEAMRGLRPVERLVYDFKNHHPRPNALGRRSLTVQTSATILFITLPESLMLNAANWFLPVPGWLILMIATMLLGGTFAQYFHGTLHRRTNPTIVRAMRHAGLLMTPQAHQWHHDTLQRDFATISGWSNSLINPLFHALRRSGRLRDTGLEPQPPDSPAND